MNGLFTRIEVFTELMGCMGNLFVWRYDASLRLLDSNCPEAGYWDNIFRTTACSALAVECCARTRYPVLLSDPLGLLWIAAPVWEQDSLQNIFMLGPVFLSTLTESQMEHALDRRGISVALKGELMRHLKQLPMIVHATFLLLGTMLHFCLTGERILIYDIQIPEGGGNNKEEDAPEQEPAQEVHGGAEYESLMLKLIEEGNLNYRSILASNTHGRVGTLAPGDSLRQFKDEIIAAITLCSRAAIRGGLSRETALTLSDYYIQSVEAAATISDVAHVNHTMREDYTRRVHQVKQQKSHSTAVKACLDVIDRQITDRLTIAQIARETGYAGYYISSLFKKEMGVAIGDYIKAKKIEYAKMLLANSSNEISDIAARLNFSTASHFSAVFRSVTGMTPKEFRAEN